MFATSHIKLHQWALRCGQMEFWRGTVDWFVVELMKVADSCQETLEIVLP